MQYLKVGDLRVSRLGFGCDPLGGHAWGRVDPAEMKKSIRLAVDLGVTIFDTADCYGRGLSETRLAQALENRRQQVVVATKFGVRLDRAGCASYDNSAVWFERALAGSLRRLRTDYIDLYQVHYWDRKTPWLEILSRLERKREAGIIRWYGVSNELLNVDELPTRPPGLVSCSFEFSLANRVNEPVIEAMRRRWDLGFLSWGSLGQGVLGGKYDTIEHLAPEDRRRRRTYVNFHGENLKRNQRLIGRIRDCLAGYPSATPAQIAIRWILNHFDFSVALVGAKTREQLRDDVGAVDLGLSESDTAWLTELTAPRARPIPQASHEALVCDAQSTFSRRA